MLIAPQNIILIIKKDWDSGNFSIKILGTTVAHRRPINVKISLIDDISVLFSKCDKYAIWLIETKENAMYVKKENTIKFNTLLEKTGLNKQ